MRNSKSKHPACANCKFTSCPYLHLSDSLIKLSCLSIRCYKDENILPSPYSYDNIYSYEEIEEMIEEYRLLHVEWISDALLIAATSSKEDQRYYRFTKDKDGNIRLVETVYYGILPLSHFNKTYGNIKYS